MKELIPVCPIDDKHDLMLGNEDCFACALVLSLYKIAYGSTDSGDPIVEASYVLDEVVEWKEK